MVAVKKNKKRRVKEKNEKGERKREKINIIRGEKALKMHLLGL